MTLRFGGSSILPEVFSVAQKSFSFVKQFNETW